MSHLLIVSALTEAGAGLALLVWPAVPVALLLGASLDAPAAVTVARLAGAALLTLGLVCWLMRHEGPGGGAARLVAAMLVYNAAAVVILAAAGIGARPAGVALWPAVVLHAGLAVWCLASRPR